MALPSLLSTAPSLWTLLDEYIVTVCTTWKNQWLETFQAAVVVAEQYNPDALLFPFILISSYERAIGEGQPVFGDGTFHIDGISYPYEIMVAAAFQDYRDAKEFSAAASSSLMDAFRADPTMGGLAANNGEYVKYFDYDDSELYVRGLAGQEPEGRYTGTAVLRLIVYTEV